MVAMTLSDSKGSRTDDFRQPRQRLRDDHRDVRPAGSGVDLGDRRFEVLHTPGHSPGSICLWETATGILIGGDTIYDGLLIDTLPDSDPAAYAVSMRRLKQLNVSAVHGGHRESFGAAKYQFLIDQYLSS